MAEFESEGEAFYLGIEAVLSLYADIFACTEQEAGDQLRNRSGLESALARPGWYAHYQNADLALQAAVLAHGIAEGQCFIEGNKRVALAALETFLMLNGYELDAPQPQPGQWILQLSKGGTVEGLAAQIRTALMPTE